MAYIFDLDGTLAETRENRKLPPEKHIASTIVFYKVLNRSFGNICMVVSGRDENQRVMVEQFCDGMGLVGQVILNDLPFPKPANHEYKRIVFQKLLDEGQYIDGVFDDNPAVGEVCRDLGIPFYLVQP